MHSNVVWSETLLDDIYRAQTDVKQLPEPWHVSYRCFITYPFYSDELQDCKLLLLLEQEQTTATVYLPLAIA